MSYATVKVEFPLRRMLKPSEAAEYCGLSLAKFKVCGISPVQMPNGTILYDLRDLDAWLDGLKAEAPVADDDMILARLGQ